jgi:hypothetical protein
MPLITVVARIASTHPVDKYPGWALSVDALEDLAEGLRAGGTPMVFDHDVTQPIEATVLDAVVIPIEDRHFAVEATFEIEEGAWASVQARFDDAGVPGGWSFTVTSPQTKPSSGVRAVVTISADAAAWTDRDRDDAREILDAVAPAESAYLFQYSAAAELATMFLEVAPQIGLGVLGNATWDAIKLLLHRRRGQGETRIAIHRTAPDGSKTTAVITTSDPEIARAALDALPEPQPSPTIRYETTQRLWLDH